jgi:hypothetical protein
LATASATPAGTFASGTRAPLLNLCLLDEVAVFHYALGTNRILAHLNAAASGETRVAIERSALVTWPAFPPGLVLQAAAPPAIGFTPAVTVSWPTFPAGYRLQSATALSADLSWRTETSNIGRRFQNPCGTR